MSPFSFIVYHERKKTSGDKGISKENIQFLLEFKKFSRKSFEVEDLLLSLGVENKKVAIMEKFKNAEDYVKPGMKVKLRKDLVADQMYGSDCWVTDMKKPGSEVVVDHIVKDDRFCVKGSLYNYTVDMLENPVKLSDTKSRDFKVGDRVRLREDLKAGVMYDGLTYLDSMLKPGTETTIRGLVTGSGNVLLTDSETGKSSYIYSPAMLEHVEEKQNISEKPSVPLTEKEEIKSRLGVGDVVKIREDIKDNQLYDSFEYRRGMIAGGRTAKITSVITFGETPAYKLDKDKKNSYYSISMFDLDYIRTRNPRFADLDQCSDKSEEEKKSATKTKGGIEIHVGDLVRLRSDLKKDERYGVETFTKSMLKNRGKIVEVSDVFEFGGFESIPRGTVFTIAGDPDLYHYTPEMVKEIISKEETKKKKRLSSKSDLSSDLVTIVKRGSLTVAEVQEVLAKMIEKETQNRNDFTRKSSLALQSLGLQGINYEDANHIIGEYLYNKEQLSYSEKRLSLLKELDDMLDD